MMMIVENIPLKYFCLKFHIWWEINYLISCLEFIAQGALYSFLFGTEAMQNVLSVFHCSLVTQMADRSQTSTGLSVYVYGGLHKVLTLPATFLLAKPIL